MRDDYPTPSDKPSAGRSRNRYTAAEWPCVFNGVFVREQVDPRIKDEWAQRRSDRPKFGDLRNTFRREHCRTVNPWGSATCPFREDECAIAFLKAVQDSLAARNAHGYFIKVCRSSGALRADMAVEQRARIRTDVTHEHDPDQRSLPARPAPSVAGLGIQGPVPDLPTLPGASVRSPFARPGHIGTVLGSLDLRPRPLPDDDEQKGPR